MGPQAWQTQARVWTERQNSSRTWCAWGLAFQHCKRDSLTESGPMSMLILRNFPQQEGSNGPCHKLLKDRSLFFRSRTWPAIPDLATWLQCFGIFVAMLAQQQPERVPELMAYQSIIAKASQKYKWPSWLVYDRTFCQDAAGNPSQSGESRPINVLALIPWPESGGRELVHHLPDTRPFQPGMPQ